LRERLADEDQGVVGASVGVVMELARRQGGRNYLPLAPELFGILTGSSNNWMLIKVVKLASRKGHTLKLISSSPS
jgi:AP-3 complex subunit delta-1